MTKNPGLPPTPTPGATPAGVAAALESVAPVFATLLLLDAAADALVAYPDGDAAAASSAAAFAKSAAEKKVTGPRTERPSPSSYAAI